MSEKKIRGSIRCVLAGGPLDGAQYGDVPNPGKTVAAAQLSIPLTQPHADSVRAIYICADPGGPDDVWEFTFRTTIFPGLPVGTEAKFA